MVEFEKGDVVRLKSGGPSMTVIDIGDYSPLDAKDGVKCTWFDDKKKLNTEVFDAAALERFKPAAPGVFVV